ncbi:MAG TPA: nucleoside triphosphate pyrophosphohydrolase [Myxococcota bacterium]|nr:nucleoside triphosphate pyrophosphohydrolase [Myxococcota bacterium]HQK50312.1 nucleoside triphosphate pyrophosphohydrolase [Myxococcota bacterium]
MDSERRRERAEAFLAFVDLMERLRAPDGCPWDRAQTLETLKTYVIEEAYEVVEAIDKHDPDDLREELGDLLLQVLFQARIMEERGAFDIAEVCRGAVRKLVARHPHVFGQESRAQDAEEALDRWEKGKRREGKGVLAGVPGNLPALLMALRVGEKVRSVGFDWPEPSGAVAKLDEEVAELKEALASGSQEAVRQEIGDLLFTVVNLARLRSIDPEDALRSMLARFKTRFEYLEARAAEQGLPLPGTPLATLDALWEEAKRMEAPLFPADPPPTRE